MIFVVGGGGLNPNNALIHVNAPLGSTVTFAKGGVTVKTILPAKSFANEDGETADYYYSVASSNYGTWTVSASLGSYLSSKTVSVSAADQYDVELELHVPTEYQEVSYIENTGQSWIDTGISPEINFAADFTGCADATGDGFFGIYATGGGSGYRAGVYVSGSNYVLFSIVGSGSTEYPLYHNVTLGELADFHYEQAANSQILQAFGLTASNNAATVALNICSFFKYIGSSTYYRKGKLKHAKIWNNGTLVRDMYSCYRKSDSVAGMWDKVSSTFLTNAGTGTFVVGSDVN